MDCQLPATGGAPAFTALAAMILLLIGVSVLVLVRRRGVTSVLAVVVFVGAALGVAGGRQAEAATMCATGTAAPAPASSVAPSSSTPAGTTSTSEAAPRGARYGPNCYYVDSDAGLRESDYLIEMTAGAGTYTAYLAHVSLQGCDGEAYSSGPVVDSEFYDPVSYCSSVLPGSHPVTLVDVPFRQFEPPIPITWFTCEPGPPLPTSTSEPTTTTTTEPTTTSEATNATEATTTSEATTTTVVL
jgi:eukaryotic-like serine/threonine-protein kinase